MPIHVLRYDDFSARSSTEVEQVLVAMLLRHRVPCTFAVIPFVSDPESLVNHGNVELCPIPEAKARILKPLLREGLADIALHGYCHLTLSAIKGYQEFSNRMPRATQERLIRAGRDHLESIFGVRVHLYVPPWNSLGSTTALVLMDEGFSLSCNTRYLLEAKNPDLAQLPAATSIGETHRTLSVANRLGGGSALVGTLIHDYDFLDDNGAVLPRKLEEFEAMLSQRRGACQASRQLISKTILESLENTVERFEANRAFQRVLQRSLICRKVVRGLHEIYWDTRSALRLTKLIKLIP